MSDQYRQVDFDQRLTEDARSLDRYLMQYRYAIAAKKILENRMRRISTDFAYRSPNFDGMPHSNYHADGNTAIIFRLSEIQDRINKQADKAMKNLTEIMDMIDYLEEGSLERKVIESRYIDMQGWFELRKTNHLSKSSATRYWKKGLYKLLEYKRVQEILRLHEGRPVN